MSSDNFPIVAIAAMELEIKPLLKGLKKEFRNGFKFYRGSSYSVIISGVGLDNAAEAAQTAITLQPKILVSIGLAGGLSPQLKPGDLFIAKAVKNDSGETISCDAIAALEAYNGKLLSAESIIQTSKMKQKLAESADAVDMETFAVAKTARQNRVPFISIRLISDSQNESIPVDFSPALVNGRLNPLKAVFLILKKPSSIPAIFSLARRTRECAERLSKIFDLICREQLRTHA